MASTPPRLKRDHRSLKHSPTKRATVAEEGNPFPSCLGSRAPTHGEQGQRGREEPNRAPASQHREMLSPNTKPPRFPPLAHNSTTTPATLEQRHRPTSTPKAPLAQDNTIPRRRLQGEHDAHGDDAAQSRRILSFRSGGGRGCEGGSTTAPPRRKTAPLGVAAAGPGQPARGFPRTRT